jgi:flavin reductase (DIM6/NTAB) family NADH-FMN oxidoreductase RutF
MPVVIVGALVQGKPNFNAIAYCGVAQSRPPMLSISMDKRRYTHQGILDNGCFSVNIPSEQMLAVTNRVGRVSGREVDKSTLFSAFFGKLEKAPMIRECPVVIECSLHEVMDFQGKNDLLIGLVVETYVDENCLVDGEPYLLSVNPLVFSRQDHRYWTLGRDLGSVSEIEGNDK